MSPRIRIAAIGISTALTLACGGAASTSVPEPVPVPVPAPVPDVATPMVRFVTWTPVGESCRVDLVEYGATVETVGILASIAAPCPDPTAEARIVRAPQGEKVLVVLRGIGVEAQLDAFPKSIPALPADFALEQLTWVGADIVATAVHRGDSVYEPHDDGDETVWTVGEQQIRYKAQGYEAGTELCGRFTLKDGAWTADRLEATGLPEGTSPPWCDWIETAGAPALMPPSSGGHGTFLIPAEGGPIGEHEWMTLEGGFAGTGGEMLEGQDYQTPLAWTGTDPWTLVEGFSHADDTVSLTTGDGWAIACRGGHSALLDLSGAPKPVWTGVACPVAWQ